MCYGAALYHRAYPQLPRPPARFQGDRVVVDREGKSWPNQTDKAPEPGLSMADPGTLLSLYAVHTALTASTSTPDPGPSCSDTSSSSSSCSYDSGSSSPSFDP